MADKMLKFVDLKQETPIKRETKKRRDDFNEIYNDYINNKAKEHLVDVRNVSSILSDPLSLE